MIQELEDKGAIFVTMTFLGEHHLHVAAGLFNITAHLDLNVYILTSDHATSVAIPQHRKGGGMYPYFLESYIAGIVTVIKNS